MLRLRERSWRQIWRFVVMPQPLPHRVEPDQEVRQRVGNLVGVLVPLDPDAQRLEGRKVANEVAPGSLADNQSAVHQGLVAIRERASHQV